MIWTDITLEVYQSNSELYNTQKLLIDHLDWQKAIYV